MKARGHRDPNRLGTCATWETRATGPLFTHAGRSGRISPPPLPRTWDEVRPLARCFGLFWTFLRTILTGNDLSSGIPAPFPAPGLGYWWLQGLFYRQIRMFEPGGATPDTGRFAPHLVYTRVSASPAGPLASRLAKRAHAYGGGGGNGVSSLITLIFFVTGGLQVMIDRLPSHQCRKRCWRNLSNGLFLTLILRSQIK
jgi:hypothetical protein